MTSFKRIIQFVLFALFLFEMLLWNPSEEGVTIIQKLLLMAGVETSIGWIYSATIAILFSISFPEIWSLIRNLIEENISRNLVKKYVSVKNKYISLILFFGLITIVFVLYLVNKSIGTELNILEFISSLKINKSFQIALYCLVPIITIMIWINNRLTILYETSKDELAIAYSIKPNTPSYVISGQMAKFEMEKLLGDKKNDYTVKVIQEFPDPITVSLNLGNIKTDFTIKVKLGVSVSQKIDSDEAKWLDKLFGDIEKRQDSTLIKILTDLIEQTISQAKLSMTAIVSGKVDSTSDLQVNALIMQIYPKFIDDLGKKISERIRMVLGANLQIIDVEILTKKMVAANIDQRIQEDHRLAQEQFRSITTSAIGERGLDNNSLGSLRGHVQEIFSSTKRPKLFNLSLTEIDDLIKVTTEVFETGKLHFEEKHLLFSKKEEEGEEDDGDTIIIDVEGS